MGKPDVNSQGFQENLYDPADDAEEVVPSNTTDLAKNSRSLYVGAFGDVKVDMASGQTVTFRNVIGGSVLPVVVRRVYATGTTASGIVSLS